MQFQLDVTNKNIITNKIEQIVDDKHNKNKALKTFVVICHPEAAGKALLKEVQKGGKIGAIH